MTVTAALNGVILAEADNVISLEGNAYFPPESIKWEHLVESGVTSRCWWKGQATYLDAVLDGKTHPSVGWTYHTPSEAAAGIADHVAFWGAVRIEATN